MHPDQLDRAMVGQRPKAPRPRERASRTVSSQEPHPGTDRGGAPTWCACHFNLQLSAFPRPPHGRWQASHARYRDLCIVARAERKVRGQGSGRHWDGAVWEAQGLAEARWTSKDNAAAGAAQSRSQRNLPVSALVMARSTFRSPVVRRVRTRLPVLGSTARSFFFVLRPFFAMIRVPVLTGQAFPKSHARALRDLYRRFLGLLNLAERDRGIPVS